MKGTEKERWAVLFEVFFFLAGDGGAERREEGRGVAFPPLSKARQENIQHTMGGTDTGSGWSTIQPPSLSFVLSSVTRIISRGGAGGFVARGEQFAFPTHPLFHQPPHPPGHFTHTSVFSIFFICLHVCMLSGLSTPTIAVLLRGFVRLERVGLARSVLTPV